MYFKTGTVSLLLAGTVIFGMTPGAFADPPGRVGRVSYINGTVSTRQDDQQDWSYAGINQPVTSGDDFWTEPSARGEIEVGQTEIHMDSSTELDVTQLDDSVTQLNVAQGTIDVRLGHDTPGGVQITTGTGQISLTTAGRYRIDAGHPDEVSGAPQGTVQVSVLKGQALINEPGAQTTLQAGEAAIVNTAHPGLNLVAAQTEPFDNWAIERDHAERGPQAVSYVSPEVTGSQDLDQYGQWASDPTYGEVWYPQNVAQDWAPYRYGHWSYVQPWGWTWVDDAPWGFAPFHYGRWVQQGPRWGWVPGPVQERPVYAPALVAFVGGKHWGLSVSEGQTRPDVGWVPLAPSEPFHPYYHASDTYILNINTHNDRQHEDNLQAHSSGNTGARYANSAAATIMPSNAFAHGTQVHKAELHVQPTAQGFTPAAPAAETSAQTHAPEIPGHHDSERDAAQAPQPSGEGWHDDGRGAGNNREAGRDSHMLPNVPPVRSAEPAASEPAPAAVPVTAVHTEAAAPHAPGPMNHQHHDNFPNSREAAPHNPAHTLALDAPHAQPVETAPSAPPSSHGAPGPQAHDFPMHDRDLVATPSAAPQAEHAGHSDHADHHAAPSPEASPVALPAAPSAQTQPSHADNHHDQHANHADHHDQDKSGPVPQGQRNSEPPKPAPEQPQVQPQQQPQDQPHGDDHRP